MRLFDNRFFAVFFCAAISVFVAAEAEAGAVEATTISVKRHAEIVSADVLLGDIAEIHAPAAIQKSIEALRLVSAPRPGSEITLSGSRITASIRRKKWLPGDAVIEAPSHVLIRRASMTIPRERLESLLQDYIAGLLPGERFAIRRFKIRGDDVFPVGEMELRIEERRPNLTRGRLNVPVAVLVNGVEAGKIFLSGRIERTLSVVCVRQEASRGQILAEKDLYLRDVTTMDGCQEWLVSVDSAVGKQLTHSLRAGASLRENMLEEPLLIHRGDRVQLVASGYSLTVVTEGVAKEDGRLREKICVENTESGQTVDGVVAGTSTVRVHF